MNYGNIKIIALALAMIVTSSGILAGSMSSMAATSEDETKYEGDSFIGTYPDTYPEKTVSEGGEEAETPAAKEDPAENPDVEAETDAETEPELESDPKAETKAEVAVNTEPKPETKREDRTERNSDDEAKTTVKKKASYTAETAGPETETEAPVETETENEPETDAESPTVPETEPETEETAPEETEAPDTPKKPSIDIPEEKLPSLEDSFEDSISHDEDVLCWILSQRISSGYSHFGGKYSQLPDEIYEKYGTRDATKLPHIAVIENLGDEVYTETVVQIYTKWAWNDIVGDIVQEIVGIEVYTRVVEPGEIAYFVEDPGYDFNAGYSFYMAASYGDVRWEATDEEIESEIARRIVQFNTPQMEFDKYIRERFGR